VADTHERTRVGRGTDGFQIQTISSTGGFVSTDYLMPVNALGATSHEWRTQGVQRLLLNASGATVPNLQVNGQILAAEVSPLTGNNRDLGSLSFQSSWRNIYLLNAPIVSSDERLKENFAEYTETDLAAARLIRGGTFTIKETGAGSSGYRAQQIIAAFVEAGAGERRPFDLGLIIEGETYAVRYELVNALRIEALFR